MPAITLFSTPVNRVNTCKGEIDSAMQFDGAISRGEPATC
jgi:hypothetical protein